MPQFPEVDPDTLAEAIKSNLRSQMNVPAIQNGGVDSNRVVRAWADAMTAGQNPSNAYFNSQINALYGQQGGQQPGAGSSTMLFNVSGTVNVGEWVYLSSSNTVALASNTSLATGPVIGVVASMTSLTTALVQYFGPFMYTDSLGLGFIPMTPDTIYYIGSAGDLTDNPTPPPGGYVQELGYAKNAYEFVISLKGPVQV